MARSSKITLIFGMIAIFQLQFFLASAQEKQVPFFPDQDIITIGKNFAKKMSFYSEYENFVEAKLFLTPKKEYALEIFYEKNDTLFKDRKVLTEVEKENYLKSLVSQYAEQVGDNDTIVQEEISVLNQKGRPLLLVANTVAGLGYYGWALPATLNVDDEKVIVSMYMLAAGTSFYLPYRITLNKDVSLAQASMTYYGQSRGIMQGIFLGEILSKEVHYSDYDNNDEYQTARHRRNRVLYGLGITGSIAEGIAGYKLADRWNYNEGSALIMQMYGDVGTISGLLFSDILNLYNKPELDAVFGTTLFTSAAGLVTGKLFGDTRNFTYGDGIVYWSTIALSCTIPITVITYFEPDDETAFTTAGLVGVLSGSYLGWKATQNKDFRTSDGIFITLGELTGGLMGVGLGYLISDFDEKVITTIGTLGALTGYGLMYYKFSKTALTVKNDVDLNISVNPLGLLMNRNKPFSPQLAPMYNIASLSLRF